MKRRRKSNKIVKQKEYFISQQPGVPTETKTKDERNLKEEMEKGRQRKEKTPGPGFSRLTLFLSFVVSPFFHHSFLWFPLVLSLLPSTTNHYRRFGYVLFLHLHLLNRLSWLVEVEGK
jgi:hypothetical protein